MSINRSRSLGIGVLVVVVLLPAAYLLWRRPWVQPAAQAPATAVASRSEDARSFGPLDTDLSCPDVDSPPSEVAMPSTLDWHEGPLPADIADRDYQRWYAQTESGSWGGEDGAKARANIRYAYIDLLNDGTRQLIVQENIGGTGGKSALILQHRAGHWRSIAEFFGGFMLLSRDKQYRDLVVYERTGDQYARARYRYTPGPGGFVFKGREDVPVELYRISGGWLNFFKFFWYLVDGTSACTK
jgi:hypothetical protein